MENTNELILTGVYPVMNYYVGIDVSKPLLDVYWNNEYHQISNDAEGLKSLLTLLAHSESTGNKIALVTCEASGGYERLLVKTLRNAAYPVHVAHANKVRAFAKAKGWLAKTDKIDAKVISLYAQVMEVLPAKYPLTECQELIKEVVKRREELCDTRAQEKNRLDKVSNPKIKKSIKAHIKWLDKSIDELSSELERLSEDTEVKNKIELLTSVPSIGVITASYIVAYLPELGSLSNKEIAALVGVAPYAHDSGLAKGKRFIQGGRQRVRNCIFMSALSSLRWNPQLRAVYDRLVARGKPAKLALTAIMRKLIIMLNSIMKRNTPWLKQEATG
ncbi:IS110 family transposase [bacterium]|nr:IS110 family transposase [bacterium]